MTSTDQKIIDLAESLIKERGYNAFSFRDISKSIGIKTASIHYHFPTKADLAKAVIERYNKAFSEKLDKIYTSSRNGGKRLEKYVELMVGSFEKGSGYCLCAALANDSNTTGEDVGSEVCDFYSLLKDWLQKVLREGRDDGTIRSNTSVSESASAIVSLFQGALLASRATGSDKPLKDAAKWVLNIMKE